MGLFSKFLSWIRPAADPEAEAEAAREREEMETIRASQRSPAGRYNLPPTEDITDPR